MLLEIEENVDKAFKDFEQYMYDNDILKHTRTCNDLAYFMSSLIFAKLSDVELEGVSAERISEALEAFGLPESYPAIADRMNALLDIQELQDHIGVLYRYISNDLFDAIDSLGNCDYVDITGRMLNVIGNYGHIENDNLNDVVLTPSYVAELMAKLARVSSGSNVVDMTAGTGGLLIAAATVGASGFLGVEFLDNVHMLATLNMRLNGLDADIRKGNSLSDDVIPSDDLSDVDALLLNPPYSAESKGLIFADRCMRCMNNGYAVVLIQDSAGNGQGKKHAKSILEHSTLQASIKMPPRLFGNKASVSVCIFVFKVGRPHQENDEVIFIDFAEDGYKRSTRKKAKKQLTDDGTAEERYQEIVDIVCGGDAA